MTLHLTATGCLLPYGITQCYLPPDSRQKWTHPVLTLARGWYWIYLLGTDGSLSWPILLVTYRDGSPAHKWSPVQLLSLDLRPVDHKSGALTTTLPSRLICKLPKFQSNNLYGTFPSCFLHFTFWL